MKKDLSTLSSVFLINHIRPFIFLHCNTTISDKPLQQKIAFTGTALMLHYVTNKYNHVFKGPKSG